MATHHQQFSERSLDPVPDDLDSAQAKLVYLCLAATGGSTVEELGETLALKKITILSLLDTLSGAGYVDERDGEYVLTG